MNSSYIEKDMPEHYKQMAEFFKNLSILSITFVAISIALSSDLFKTENYSICLKISVFMFLISTIASVFGHLVYADVFRTPELLTGSNYKKLVFSTAKPLICFIVAGGSIVGYVVLNLIN